MRSVLEILRRGLEPRRLTVFTVGLLALCSGFYGWLRLPDSNGFYLLLQAIVGVLLLAASGALVSGTVASLAGLPGRFGIRGISRRAPIGVLVLIAAAMLYWFLELVESEGASRAYVVSSWLSYISNHPVPIPPFRSAWEVFFLFLYLAVLPALAIRILAWRLRRSHSSLAAEAVASAPPPAAGQPRRANFLLFWTIATALAVVFDWLPWQLAWWAPPFRQGWAEVLSALLRLGIAGLAFACGLVIQWSWYIGRVLATPTAARVSAPPDSAA